MQEDVPLKVEAWPIEKVIAYASNPRKRTPAAVDKLAASVPVALCASASRRRRGRVQHLRAPHRSVRPVRIAVLFAGRRRSACCSCPNETAESAATA